MYKSQKLLSSLSLSAFEVNQKDVRKDTGRLHTHAEFCGGQVAVHHNDISRMVAFCSSRSSPSLILFGFKKMRTLSSVHLIDSPLLAYCNVNQSYSSRKALCNLHQSMLKKDVYAVGEILLRTSTSPRLVAIVPKQEPGCFQIIRLPYQEEVNYVSSEDVTFASKTQVDAADGMLSSSVISINDRQIQSILSFDCLEPVSLGKGLVKPHDTIFTYKETIPASDKNKMEKFAMSLPKCESAKSNRKRKQTEEKTCKVVNKAFKTSETEESDGEVQYIGTSTTQNSLASDVQSMKVKDIKRELESYRISTALIIEKDELVKALINARKGEHDYRAAAHLKYQQQQARSLYRQPNDCNSSSTGYQKAYHEGSIRKLDTVEKLNTKQTQAYNMAIKEGKNIFITGPGKIMSLSVLLDCNFKLVYGFLSTLSFYFVLFTIPLTMFDFTTNLL